MQELFQYIFVIAIQHDVVIAQRCLEEIVGRGVHLYPHLGAAHIDVVCILNKRAGAQVIFVQAFASAFYDGYISRRQDSLNTDAAFRLKMVAYDELLHSEMFRIPISTLRYYDKEGFFPNLERSGNIRKFSDNELASLKLIECLKKSGLEIKDIKQFFKLVSGGSSTYAERKEIFEARKIAVEEEIATLEKTLAMLKFKCWYYEKAMADGNEDSIHEMMPDNFPPEIQALYDKAHV